MTQELVAEGFIELSVEESTQINGGWSIWTLFGMAAVGWCKLFAVAAVSLEQAIGLYDWSFQAIDYYWGEEQIWET